MQDKLRGAFQPALPFCCSMGSFTAFSTSTNLHPPPPSSRTSSAHAVASTLGNGGTSRNHSPASREFLSTSTSNRSATRTTVAGRWRPTRMWSTDSLVFFSTVSAVSTNEDRKSTRLNSSHGYISYAVFCLKKKKKKKKQKTNTL